MRKKDLTPRSDAENMARGLHLIEFASRPGMKAEVMRLAESYLALREVVKEQRRTIAALQ